MAYFEKYFLTYCAPSGKSCKISILKDDFIGDSIELIGSEDPIKITYDNSDDFKFKAIIESKATIGLVLDDDVLSLSELWTSNERTYKVEHIIEGVLDWAGFIIPEGFNYALKGGKYEAEITAQDGLATLEGFLFKTDNNEFYGVQNLAYNNGFQFPFILVLTEILRKLDLGIDLWTLVDYYEQTMLSLNINSRNSDPLAVSYVNVKTYINDTDRKDVAYFEDINEAWDCKKIIENICNIWGSRIYQQNGVWRFKSIHADSAIANPYTTGSDSFAGTNPVQEEYFWKYETYYSINSDINFDTTVFFYSNYATVTLSDFLYDADIDPIPAGYYLIKGLDKLLQVDSSGKVIKITAYESAVSDYYWKKYNNTAGYLGRELVDTGTTIPCSNKEVFLKDNDAEIRMDNVYKQYRVNFEYIFIRDGDTPINLLKNGDFSAPFEQYGQLESPPNWERWRAWGNKWYIRERVNTLPSLEQSETEGNTHSLHTQVQYNENNISGTDPYPAIWTALKQGGLVIDTKVKLINFTGWIKFMYKEPGGEQFTFYPAFKAILYPNPPVVNNGLAEVYFLTNIISDDYDLGWVKVDFFYGDGLLIDLLNANKLIDSSFFLVYPWNGKRWKESEQNNDKWYDFNLRVQPPPKIGSIDFFIHGLCGIHGKKTKSFPPFNAKHQEGGQMVDYGYPVALSNSNPRPQFTGLNFGYIPNPEEEVPKTDYIYANGDVNYTFQEDPIRIYNGDTESNEIVSGITVLTNASGRNKWDTFNNAFGKTDIGMILCKSVMQQYYKPNRLLDCEFKSEAYNYGDIISLEHIPNVKFIMLRGTYNAKRSYWENCTLARISNDEIIQGGVINGDTLDPNWQATGRTRCVKDFLGVNTGISEYETQDINTNSDSFGDFRWQSSGENLIACPIGEPSKYYWGTDSEDYDLANFTDFTITYKDDSIGEVQVSYNNTGEKYIYFIHLSSLGSVVQVSNQYQSQINSSFTYIDDVIINGYLYRVLRQNFVTSQFDNFSLTYYIQ